MQWWIQEWWGQVQLGVCLHTFPKAARMEGWSAFLYMTFQWQIFLRTMLVYAILCTVYWYIPGSITLSEKTGDTHSYTLPPGSTTGMNSTEWYCCVHTVWSEFSFLMLDILKVTVPVIHPLMSSFLLCIHVLPHLLWFIDSLNRQASHYTVLG